MKCTECPKYLECVKVSNLAIKRKNCPKAKVERQLTNADRIRAMSDRELAWFFAEKYANEAALRVRDLGNEPTATEIKALTERLYYTWMRWLQQPVQEDKAEKYEIDKLFSSGIMSKEELRNLLAQQWGVE